MIRLTQSTVLLFLLFLIGCGSNNVGISITGLNYTNRHISEFSVDGYSAGNISPNGGGGSTVCCVSIPANWRNGLRLTIRWYDDEGQPQRFKEKIVEIPQYKVSDLGRLNVHFYENDTVKVLVTTKTEDYPGYPFPRPERHE